MNQSTLAMDHILNKYFPTDKGTVVKLIMSGKFTSLYTVVMDIFDIIEEKENISHWKPVMLRYYYLKEYFDLFVETGLISRGNLEHKAFITLYSSNGNTFSVINLSSRPKLFGNHNYAKQISRKAESLGIISNDKE